MSDFPVTIDDFNSWCSAANISPRNALLRIVNFDHPSMRMLETLLLWGKNQAVTDNGGWFYRTQAEWETEDGLTRRMLPRITGVLKAIGLVTAVKRIRLASGALLGTVATHYTVERDAFKAAFDALIVESTKGEIHKKSSRELHITGNRELHTPRESKDSIKKSLENNIGATAQQSVKAPKTPAPPKPAKRGRKPKPEAKPRKFCPPEPVYEAVELHVAGIKSDPNVPYAWQAPIGYIAKWLKGEIANWNGMELGKISHPAEARHVEMFAKWYRNKHQNAALPTNVEKFIRHWRAWASSFKSETAPAAREFPHQLGQATDEEYEQTRAMIMARKAAVS